MEFDEAFKKLDLTTYNFSLAVVTASEKFVDWISNYYSKNGIDNQGEYDFIEDDVWIIPPLDAFSKPGELDAFISTLKPLILSSILIDFGIPENVFSLGVSEDSFDTMFKLSLRLRAASSKILLERGMGNETGADPVFEDLGNKD